VHDRCAQACFFECRLQFARFSLRRGIVPGGPGDGARADFARESQDRLSRRPAAADQVRSAGLEIAATAPQ